ncbi:rhodanese-like domain-containing protein [Pseudanabaena galeata UHCC 0370]|uniref:Rhodanese-like domain-containing protein n=1 Tax=Pseudanabaena galeata UHCC 0370 TaxID=3110310 RepID=A0ABU5TQH9_9CYAN|nr:rhodanese-like domain-containing protein [Pseudanabaena galeata]MEA5480593.1 rhodanese-like domain-containing protein [Pseudanabaena galeata UHCC 0370]
MKSIPSLLLGIILSFCLLLSLQPNAIASEPIDIPNLLSSIEGYPRLEISLDKYLMAIPSGYYTIADVEELKSLMADHQALLVDVREPSEYQLGHIPNAINIPLRTISRNLSKILSDRPVVLYCSTGYRSSMGVMTLHLLNYDNVKGFPPSLSGWKQAGEAISKT